MNVSRQEKRKRRRRRIRATVSGTAERPRLCVFKSNKHIYAQVINDDSGETLASADSLDTQDLSMSERAEAVGKAVAEAAQAQDVEQVVFDRSGYNYTGNIKLLADSARNTGLDF